MNKLIAYTLILGLAILFSCRKDESKATFDTDGTYSAAEITLPAAGADIVITADNQSDEIKFKWTPANYSLSVGVIYTLTADSAGSKMITLGSTNADTIVMTYADLNKKLLDNKLAANVSIPLSVKVTSVMDNQKNELVSEIITINVTAYKKIEVKPFSYLYIAGDFQGWDIANAVPIASVTSNQVYEGYIYVPNGGSYKLYTEKGNWNSTSYGDSGEGATGILIVANYAGANLVPPAGEGYYEIMVNTKDMTWSQTKTTWSIIGDATPGGWDTDTQMSYDVDNKVWKVTANMKANGSFKFRANNEWVIDFGIDSKGKLVYADNPIFGYTAGLNNMTVPSDGNYTITLNLSNPGAYTYSVVKN